MISILGNIPRIEKVNTSAVTLVMNEALKVKIDVILSKLRAETLFEGNLYEYISSNTADYVGNEKEYVYELTPIERKIINEAIEVLKQGWIMA